jgi:shikimate kinase
VDHIVVVGLMGSGKTTIGRLLAERLKRPFVDSDEAIEARTGRTARELQDELGDDRMHALEAEHLLDALRSDDRSVIAAAASTIESPECRTALSEPGVTVVWLRASIELLATRFASSRHRPRFGSDVRAFLREQAERREPLFASLGPTTVDIDGLEPPDVVDRIVRALTP